MLKQINLKNKIALVTGAGKGIGKACAIALAQAGAKVIIVSRTKSDLEEVSKNIKKTKGASQFFVFDVTNTSTHKVRFSVSSNSGNNTVVGGNAHNATFFNFIRLGDT